MQVPPHEEFVVLMVRHQRVIWRFINTLLPSSSEADDVLQETSLVLWRKWGEFDRERDFISWAFGIARFQVLKYIRENRSKREYLDEAILAEIATLAEKHARNQASIESRLDMLKECISKLREYDRSVVEARYVLEQSVQQITEKTGKPMASVYTTLRRARIQLGECVARKFAANEGLS